MMFLLQGSYFNDYCNWQTIQEFREFAFESQVKEDFDGINPL